MSGLRGWSEADGVTEGLELLNELGLAPMGIGSSAEPAAASGRWLGTGTDAGGVGDTDFLSHVDLWAYRSLEVESSVSNDASASSILMNMRPSSSPSISRKPKRA